jgi:hypothetical protein
MSSFTWLAAPALIVVACGGQITTTTDGGTQTDASDDDGAVCVDIEPSAFTSSCNVTNDCIAIAAGTFCSGYNCSCPSASISASAQSAYQAQISKVPKGPSVCSCPALGSPKCISAQCVFCPNPALKPQTFPPGCPTSECEAAGGTCKQAYQGQCMGGGASMGQLDCPSGQGCCN